MWVAPVSSPRRTMLCPLGRDLGMPKGSAWGHLGQTTMDRTLSAAPRPLVGVLRRSLLWGENLSLRRPKHGLRARSPECRLRSPKVVDMEQGAAPRYRMVVRISGDGLRDNSGDGLRVKPSPREPATIRTHASPEVRGGDRQLPQYLWGRRRPPWYAPSPSFWSTRGRLEQDSRASLRTQPRATRANRAQSTAHH